MITCQNDIWMGLLYVWEDGYIKQTYVKKQKKKTEMSWGHLKKVWPIVWLPFDRNLLWNTFLRDLIFEFILWILFSW